MEEIQEMVAKEDAAQQKHKAIHICNLNVMMATLKQNKKKQRKIKFKNIYDLIQYIQNIII